jgi:hypothetical protein
VGAHAANKAAASNAAAAAPVEAAQPAAPPLQEPPASAPASSAADPIEQLTQLAALRDSGVVTDAEFEAQKARILA